MYVSICYNIAIRHNTFYNNIKHCYQIYSKYI